MRIQPRQQLLEIWRAVAEASFADREWVWGGRSGRNSISDAEQLLCLMAPAAEIPIFKLDLPDETAEDVEGALAPLGDARDIPTKLVSVLKQYLERYRDAEGAPIFSGGSYFTVKDDANADPTAAQESLDVVDSYAVSVRLALAILGFVKVFRSVLTRADLLDEVQLVEAMAKRRLTAAMIGLLRSYAVYVFDNDSEEDKNLCRLVNQTSLPTRRAREMLLDELRDIRAGLRDVTLGIGELPDLDNPNKLFECGWSWGVTVDAPPVKTRRRRTSRNPTGIAQAAPYLYFTVVALDGIPNLFSGPDPPAGPARRRAAAARRCAADPLGPHPAVLVDASPASAAAGGRWRTCPGVPPTARSPTTSACSSRSIVVQDLTRRPDAESTAASAGCSANWPSGRGSPGAASRDEPDVRAAPSGLPARARRHRGRRPDAARLVWRLVDFSPLLLKRTIRVARLSQRRRARGGRWSTSSTPSGTTTSHKRRLRPASGCGTGRTRSTTGIGRSTRLASWYYTERVVELPDHRGRPDQQPRRCAARALVEQAHRPARRGRPPLRPGAAAQLRRSPARRCGGSSTRPGASLRRATTIVDDRPGTAASLARRCSSTSTSSSRPGRARSGSG